MGCHLTSIMRRSSIPEGPSPTTRCPAPTNSISSSSSNSLLTSVPVEAWPPLQTTSTSTSTPRTRSRSSSSSLKPTLGKPRAHKMVGEEEDPYLRAIGITSTIRPCGANPSVGVEGSLAPPTRGYHPRYMCLSGLMATQ